MPKHLLVADDSITIRKVVEMTFAGEGIDVTSVDNGEDLLAQARQRTPDVILADAAMPRMDGYAACEALKADPSLRDVPVLLLAGTFEAFDEARARAAHADGHLAKPFESQALLTRVKALLHLDGGAAALPAAPGAASHRGPPPQRVPVALPPTSPRPLAAPPPSPRPPLPHRPAPVPVPIAARPPSPPRDVWSTTSPPAPAPIPSRPRPSAPLPMPPATAEPLQTVARPPPVASEPLPALQSALELDWSDLGEPAAPVRPSAPTSLVAPPPPSPVAGAVVTTLEALDFGEPSAFAEPPRAPLELEADELEIIELPLIDLEEEAVEEVVDVPASPEAVLAGPVSRAPGEAALAGPQAAALDGGEALLREALSRASREVIERIAWEIVPQLAEVILREHVERLAKVRQA